MWYSLWRNQGGNTLRTLCYAVGLCASLSIMAAAQTEGPSAAPPKRPTANAVRTIPAVKCVDQDTAAACKSFKELVEAGDERLLRAIHGDEGHERRHISYVCFRPRSDAFGVIEFYIPNAKTYRPPSTINEELVRYADDSLPTNRMLRETEERSKKLIEDSIFMDFDDPPAVSRYTKDQWFQDHSKDFVYSLGFVADSLYQDGLNKGVVMDQGEWSMLAGGKGSMQHDSPSWFVGAHAWIERFNLQHGDVSSRDDDHERGHISLDPSSIHIHFTFENPSRSVVDYTLQINRLTGRFVESFRFPDDNDFGAKEE